MSWVNEIAPEQRQAILFASCYERVRKTQQVGYRVWPELEPGVLETTVVKTAGTVARWLAQKGWKISWNEVSWQGYVRFCFEALRPTMPMLGQLRNERLLRQYLASAPASQAQGRTPEQLEALYRRVLRSEFATTPFMARLGLLAR